MTLEQALEKFCRDCAAALEERPGSEGRAAVVGLLGQALADPDFATACFGAGESGRRLLYQDPSGFCVLAYDMAEPRVSPPHDHGPSWAIYGQSTGHTDMTEFERAGGDKGPGPARLKELRRYRLNAGEVGLFDIAAIHRIDHPADVRFVRISGRDMESVPRLKYDLDAGLAIEVSGTSVPG